MWNSKKNRPNHQLELVEKKEAPAMVKFVEKNLQIIPCQLMQIEDFPMPCLVSKGYPT